MASLKLLEERFVFVVAVARGEAKRLTRSTRISVALGWVLMRSMTSSRVVLEGHGAGVGGRLGYP